MGTEILYPMLVGLKWGLMIFLCLSVAYALIFRFRNYWRLCRIGLYVTWSALAVLLSVPTAIYIFVSPGLMIAALAGDVQPFSDRIGLMGIAVAMGTVIVGAWWALTALLRHLERTLQAEAKPA